jgi:sugar/nucleoside kinase (ribokinase family)
VSMSEYRKELQTFLEQETGRECKVVVMPDFFLDRLVNLDLDVSEFSALIAEVAKRKGGSIDEISQVDLRGGNGVNVASALASLGVNVTPIVCTSEFGFQHMKYLFRNFPVDLTRVKICSKASITTALEFSSSNGKTNVMLRDLGSLADFGPESLSEDDYADIENSDYTCLFNWAGTCRHGTALAQAVFERAKRGGKGKTYCDTADPGPNAKAIPEFIKKVLESGNVDVLSLNENEAITYASQIEGDLRRKEEALPFTDLAMQAARVLAKRLPTRIDLHTTAFSATLKGKRETVVSTFRVEVLRATGAGDAWNAGNILGDWGGLSEGGRLVLANAVSACYLSDLGGMHPNKRKLSAFLRDKI